MVADLPSGDTKTNLKHNKPEQSTDPDRAQSRNSHFIDEHNKIWKQRRAKPQKQYSVIEHKWVQPNQPSS